MALAKKPPAQASRQLFYTKQPNRQNITTGYTEDSCAIPMPAGQHGKWTSGVEQRYSSPRPSQRMVNVVSGRSSSDAGRSPAIGRLSDGE